MTSPADSHPAAEHTPEPDPAERVDPAGEDGGTDGGSQLPAGYERL